MLGFDAIGEYAISTFPDEVFSGEPGAMIPPWVLFAAMMGR